MPADETGQMTLCTKAISLSFLFHLALIISFVILSQKENHIKPQFAVYFDLALATVITENSAYSTSSRHTPATAQTVSTAIDRPMETVHRHNASPIKAPDQIQNANRQNEKYVLQSPLSREKTNKGRQVPAKTPLPIDQQGKPNILPLTPTALPTQENSRSHEFGINKMSQTKEAQTGKEATTEYHKMQGGKEENRYLQNNFAHIRKLILQNLTFPTAARKMGWTGKLRVKFTIMQSGEVAAITILSSSGHAQLDDNVISAIQRTSPFPKPPAQAQMILPIAYRLK